MDNPTTFWGWVFYLLHEYGVFFLDGCRTTLLLSLLGTLLGCIIGLLVGVLRTIPKPHKNSNLIVKALYHILQFIMLAYIEVFRGTPMMVQAMLFYYGSSPMLGIDMSPLTAGFLVVSINTGAYMAETVRGGIQSIEPGQTEAAMAMGMTHWQTMYNVILPQTVRNILPQIGNNLIINIKDTSVLNVIAVTELYFSGVSAVGVYYQYFPTFFIISVLYFIMTFTCSRLLRVLERRIEGSDNYQMVDPMADPASITPVSHGKGGSVHKWGK